MTSTYVSQWERQSITTLSEWGVDIIFSHYSVPYLARKQICSISFGVALKSPLVFLSLNVLLISVRLGFQAYTFEAIMTFRVWSLGSLAFLNSGSRKRCIEGTIAHIIQLRMYYFWSPCFVNSFKL